MATEEDVAAGLIDWINSLEVAEPFYTADDLSDGKIIWKVLHQIDRLSFPGKLPENPESDQWVRKWSNLKHINDALSIFLIEECSKRLPLPSGAPDLKSIAQSSSLHDTIALLKLVVVAAINCGDRIKFLEPMQELAESTQEVLMTTAQEAGEDDRDEPDSEDEQLQGRENTPEKKSTEIDSDLASEERLGRVIADNQRIAYEKRDLQRQLDEAYSRYEKLQERHARNQEELRETNDRLSAVLAGKIDGQTRPLDAKHDAIIGALESRVAAAETENDELRKSNELLKIKAEKAQKLQDDYDEIKVERDRLSRKANAAEKYKQKLEASQELEKENQNLREKVSELQAQLRQSDSTRMSSSDLQREIDEYRRLLPSIEQERYELNEMKKRLEFDYHTLEARYNDRTEQLTKQQNMVEELQGRLRDYEDEVTPSTPADDKIKDLESEEADFAASEARLTAALLNGDTDAENGISEEELKAIMAAMRAQAQAGEANERETNLRAQKKLFIALEKTRSHNKQLREHAEKQSELIQNLRTKADEEGQSAPKTEPDEPTRAFPPSEAEARITPTVSPATESKMEETLRLNENLRRELSLMTSAWYEQNRRLASSGAVTVRTRGAPEPRSFLGKQRKAVDAIALGGSTS